MTLDVQIRAKTYLSRTPGVDHTAIAGIDFSVPEGQFTCIVGPSGCGKTTLLNIVSGLEQEVDGTVSLGGKPTNETVLGYMFQTPRLMPWLTVLENVRLVIGHAGNREEGDETLACHLLEEMNLGDVMDAFPSRLSGGMLRRVALARAFVVKPRLLLMDEPFISLDEPVAKRLRTLLLAIWNERPTTVLFITHDLNEALFLADRILFMSPSPGRIVHDYMVPLERPRAKLASDYIRNLRASLLEENPELLTGLMDEAEARKRQKES